MAVFHAEFLYWTVWGFVLKGRKMTEKRINLDEPRYDQNTFEGRAKHFFITTNPLNIFVSGKELDHAKSVVEKYRKGDNLPGMSEDEIWRAKHLYDSAFHPDTKEKMLLIGRITTPAVIFWQWFNQSFNAIVNYTNRSGDHPISVNHLGLSYVLATGGAVGTALGINSLVKRFPPLIEIMHGIPIFDENGNRLGESTMAARKAISQVVFSRIMMATPGMIIPPFIMNYLDKKPFMQRMPWINAPLQVLLVGFFLVFATPLCCALFPQKSSMHVNHLEHEIREKLQALPNAPDKVYFNKGL
ncbi:hypothetical protein KUTeg_004815 [Tegillarca granosa]|uniref:Sideroflexin n=1 Tax=Tegillarca granosa TaxID=220873 RepID=A0ABQ9FHY4_TEGGR|nr:hypothetical protein KUTeg_004815 [Tegillarca granosa]